MYADKLQTALLALLHPICAHPRASAVGLSLYLDSRLFAACPTKPFGLSVVIPWAGEVGSIRGCFVRKPASFAITPRNPTSHLSTSETYPETEDLLLL
jgi:hypothetical protein